MQQDILPWIALNYNPKDQRSLVHRRHKLVLEQAVQRGEDDDDDNDYVLAYTCACVSEGMSMHLHLQKRWLKHFAHLNVRCAKRLVTNGLLRLTGFGFSVVLDIAVITV